VWGSALICANTYYDLRPRELYISVLSVALLGFQWIKFSFFGFLTFWYYPLAKLQVQICSDYDDRIITLYWVQFLGNRSG
jgi:hypothetical protein